MHNITNIFQFLIYHFIAKHEFQNFAINMTKYRNANYDKTKKNEQLFEVYESTLFSRQ